MEDTVNYVAPSPSEYKVTFVGDTKCGKTALIHRFLHDTYLEVYTPTGFQRYSGSCDMGDKRINFTLWDTSGSCAYDNIRPLAYQDTRAFVLCFNIGQPDTLDNVVKKWYPEVRLHCPEVPVILCGCYSDARTNVDLVTALARQRKLPVTFDHATMAGKLVGATCYLETSSRNSSKSVRDAFDIVLFLAAGKPVQSRLLSSMMTSTSTAAALSRSSSSKRSSKHRSFTSKVRLKGKVRTVQDTGKTKTWSCTIM